jgi:DNA repair protein SbcC/Rad50
MERARRELHRVRSLATVLDLTTDYLQRAQDKTYNDLAPILNKSLDMWLPRVTHDRYLRSRVDPESLEVRVESASGAVFRADLLSVGTAEQIYLLLRVALAEHLADKKTVSPLLLDDVTVQADPTRTEAVLEMCKALADGGRQVVLFAQDPSVAAWAEAHLEGDRHSLIRLGVPAVA